MESLRVATITFDWYPFDPRVRRLAEAAADSGCIVDVICLCQHNEKAYDVCNGVRIHRVPMDRGFGRPLPVTLLNWSWFTLLAGAVVTRLHLKHAYDVIHVHNMPDFLVFSALIPRLFGAKVILDVQDVTPELMETKAKGFQQTIVKHLAIWQEHISTSFADHVVTVGWPFEELLLQRGVSQEKMTSILNSADPKIFPPEKQLYPGLMSFERDRPFIVMYHGTLSERNSLDVAIRAVALACRVIPQLRLDIQGRGEQLPLLKKLARELGISERVRFTDLCPSEEIVDFIVHGDVGIIPYQRDGFMERVLPTKAYEFAWMHCPIIASDTPAMRSIFRPESVVFCDPSQPGSFAQAIIDLYQHPEMRANLIANAAKDYEPYRWELMAERYKQLLTSLTNRSVTSFSCQEELSKPSSISP